MKTPKAGPKAAKQAQKTEKQPGLKAQSRVRVW